MNASLFTQGLSFLLYWLAQVILFRNVALFDTAFCFIYVGFILLLPLEISLTALLFVSFGMGIAVDVFYDTAGVHAAATVFLGYIRPFLLQLIRPSSGYDGVEKPSVSKLSLSWFLLYTGSGLLFHHIILFALQDYDFSLWFYHIPAILASTTTGMFVLTIIQFLFYRK